LLYEAGYRKQSEGEWIGEADGYADGELVYDVWYCSECNHCIDDGTDDADLLPNYCPNCGAKMKGENK
jgi:rubrerythrin